MPYSPVSGMVSRRAFEAQELRRACTATGVGTDAGRAIRGLIYVTLYGMYERSVADCVSTAISLANTHAISTASLKYGFTLFALRPDFDSFRAISHEKTWQRGLALLQKVGSADAAHLECIFPADGSFMRPSQLKLIWELFGLSGDPWPTPRLIGRINELVAARNHIAHGSQSAGERGGMVSDSDMDDRIRDVESLCLHIVGCFGTQLKAATDFVR